MWWIRDPQFFDTLPEYWGGPFRACNFVKCWRSDFQAWPFHLDQFQLHSLTATNLDLCMRFHIVHAPIFFLWSYGEVCRRPIICVHTHEISKALRVYQGALKDDDKALARHVRASHPRWLTLKLTEFSLHSYMPKPSFWVRNIHVVTACTYDLNIVIVADTTTIPRAGWPHGAHTDESTQ